MRNKTRAKISLFLSAMAMMTFLAPAAVIADMVPVFPNASISMIQMVISVPSLISIPFGMIAANLAKRLFKKSLIIFSMFCYLVGGTLPYFMHHKLGVILLSSGIIGIGMGIAMPSLTALICELFSGSERGSVLGFFTAFIALGGMVSSILGGYLGALQWYRAFLTYLVVIPIIILAFILLPKGKLDQKEEKEGERVSSRKIANEVWFIALTGLVFYVCINVYNNNASILIAERSLGGSVESGYITSFYTLAGLVTGAFIGNVVSRLKRKTIALGYTLGALGLMMGFIGDSIFILCLGAFITGVGFCIFVSTANYHVSELSKPGTLTFSIAFLSAIINLGQAISPLMINFMSSAVGSEVGIKFMISGGLSAVIAVLAWIGLKNPNEVGVTISDLF